MIKRISGAIFFVSLCLYRAFSICFLFWACGFFLFAYMVQGYDVPSDMVKTDGIIVFTGDMYRVEESIRLFNSQNPKPMLRISGVREDCIASIKGRSEKISSDNAKDTICNFALSAQWIEENNLHSVRIVTSNYHIPRCAIISMLFWPTGVTKVFHPVYQSALKGSLEQHLRTMFLEYNKLVASIILLLEYTMGVL
ncbi:YdcF family protein [Candidatus Hydrogenosomobacter endosymbioticus]|uniref:YdcF family protein n=1 Tax=Candidatus Hydrogenosomobacter endosymbioticus TaxID=2558174 RepID=UPI001F40921D|nr:YdcF family protein [Candidatus Hydrogenosomobacter endosymbioticus]